MAESKKVWSIDLLPEGVSQELYESIRNFWGEPNRRTPKDYFRDIEEQWDGHVKNNQYVWIEPGEKPGPKRFSVKEIAGWKKGRFVHRWNNMAEAILDDGTNVWLSCGGSLFGDRGSLINASK